MKYPNWLGLGLLNGFSWSASAEATMPRFLDEYTLHDSSWIGLWSEPEFETVALIGWDTHWSRGRLPYPVEGTPGGYPYLLIQFGWMYRLGLSFEADATATIASASSRLVKPSECSFSPRVGLSERVFQTIVAPISGGDVELWHGGATRFLCLDGAGRPLPIPDL